MSGSTPADRGTFVAIDFETADEGRDSACAVALVRVEDGQETARAFSLIRPPRREFVFTHIHGITWEDVEGERPFAEVWPELAPLLEGAHELVAHNASFDRSVLDACCAAAGLEAPRLPWSCTVDLARQTWPHWRNHKLPTCCSMLGLSLRHHDAESDAEACAAIFLRAKSIGTRQVGLFREEEPTRVRARGKERCGVKGCPAPRAAACAFPVIYLGEIGVADGELGECGARLCQSHALSVGGVVCCQAHAERMRKPQRPWRWRPGLRQPGGIGRPGERSDGRMAPVTLLKDGAPLAGYESELSAQRDALYFSLSHEANQRAVWATAREGQIPRFFDVARKRGVEGAGAGDAVEARAALEAELENVWPTTEKSR